MYLTRIVNPLIYHEPNFLLPGLYFNLLFRFPEGDASRTSFLMVFYSWWVKNDLEELIIMQVNDLGFVASILFVLVPAVFLLILYIQTASREGSGN